jgi:hypothetical protein
MSILATAPWNIANPLLLKIGTQLQQQTTAPASGNSQEMPGLSAQVDVKAENVHDPKPGH